AREAQHYSVIVGSVAVGTRLQVLHPIRTTHAHCQASQSDALAYALNLVVDVNQRFSSCYGGIATAYRLPRQPDWTPLSAPSLLTFTAPRQQCGAPAATRSTVSLAR